VLLTLAIVFVVGALLGFAVGLAPVQRALGLASAPPRVRAERRRKSVAQSTAIFAVWTGVSRVAGLAREVLVAALYGTQGSINAFVIAFQLPSLLRWIVAESALSAAFVPVFTELQERGKRDEARRLAGALMGLITLVLGLLTLLAIAVAPWVVPLFAPGLPPSLQDEAVTLARIMFPVVVLLGLTGLVVAILQANGEFGASAFAPVLWNVVIIAFLVWLAPRVEGDRQIAVYAIAVVAATLVQLAYLALNLRGKGPFPLSLGLRDARVRRVVALMLPAAIGFGLVHINTSVDSLFATLVEDEAPRAIDAAFRLYVLPQGVFSIAISTVLFPTISRLAARGDIDGMRTAVTKGLRAIVFFQVPAAVLLMLLSKPIVQLVFERGEFDGSSTQLTSEALLFFAPGMVFIGASQLLIVAFFGLQQPWLPTKVALLGVGLNAVLDAAFYRAFGVGGIPLATTLTSVLAFAVLYVLLERRLGALGRGGLPSGLLWMLLAAMIAGVLGVGVWRATDAWLGTSTVGLAVAMFGAVVAASLCYLAIARLLRLPEATGLKVLLRRQGGQGNPPNSG
jgi:putative peptidoglycan lipid II flippase